MTTQYTSILQLALPVTGELNGTWGDVVNDSITSMIEQAIAGKASISSWTGASHTLTTADGATDEARCAILDCTGAPGAAAEVICPAKTKLYVIHNGVTGGYAVTLKTASGTGISVANGSTALLYCDGTNVVAGGPAVASGTAIVTPASGGTGIAGSYSNGQLLIGKTDGTLAKATLTQGSGVTITNGDGTISISAVGSGGTVTSVDVSGGTTGLTYSGGPITTGGTITMGGTLAVGSGGTGLATVTTGNLLLGNGTSAMTTLAPGAAGDIVVSTGSTFTTTANAAAPIGMLQYFAAPTTGTYPGSSWLACNGAVVSQSTYSSLYGVIGTYTNATITTNQNGPNAANVTGQGATNPYIYDMAYGNGIYLAGGTQGYVYKSTDGISWNSGVRPFATSSTNTVNAIASNGTTFVCVNGGSGTVGVAKSTNGTSWTTTGPSFSNGTTGVKYLNGRFVVWAGATSLMWATSTDAITWTNNSYSFGGATPTDVSYGAGVYCFVGSGGNIHTTTDFVTFTARTSGTVSNLSAIAYNSGSGTFFVTGNGSANKFTSTDGITWTSRSSATAPNFFYTNPSKLFSDGTYFFGITNGGGALYYSASGAATSWSTLNISLSSGTPQFCGYLAANKYGLAGLGAGAFTPTVWATTNTTLTTNWAVGFTSVVYGGTGTKMVFGGGGGSGATVVTTTDGVTFSRAVVDATTTRAIKAVAYGNSTYLAVGNTNLVYTSTDAITWTAQTNARAATIVTATYGNGKFVTVDDSGYVGTSTDGITWATSSTILNAVGQSTAVVYMSGYGYANCDNGGGIYTSTDANTWTLRTSGVANSIYCMAYGNGTLVAPVANAGVIYSNDNGITWASTTTLFGTDNGYAIGYTNNKFMAFYSGGPTATYIGVATSPNGVTWSTSTQANTGAAPSAVGFGFGKAYLTTTNNFVSAASLYTYNPNTDFVLPNQSGNATNPPTDKLFIKATA